MEFILYGWFEKNISRVLDMTYYTQFIAQNARHDCELVKMKAEERTNIELYHYDWAMGTTCGKLFAIFHFMNDVQSIILRYAILYGSAK